MLRHQVLAAQTRSDTAPFEVLSRTVHIGNEGIDGKRRTNVASDLGAVDVELSNRMYTPS